MKKFYLAFICMAIILQIPSCKKNETVNEQNNLIADAKAFFDSQFKRRTSDLEITSNSFTNPPSAYGRAPIWSRAITITVSGKTLLSVPLKYDSLFYVSSSASGKRFYLINEVSRLCIYKDSTNKFHFEVITVIPDSGYFINKIKSFTGLMHVDDWDGTPLHSYIFNSAGEKTVTRQKKFNASGKTADNSMAPAQQPVLVIETCYYTEGYNYVPGTDNGYYYTQELGCEYEIIGTGSDATSTLNPGNYSAVITAGGMGGGSSVNPVNLMPIVSGDNIIGNIKDYDKCFTNIAGNSNSYTVMLCVDQPVPGTRQPWGFAASGSSAGTNLINVGHSFLIFTESGANGTVQRNIGFYPADYVTPLSPADPGQLNNDNAHSYNISLSVTVNNSQFFNMLNYVSSGSSQTYNLNTNNCTSFVLHVLEAGNININTSFGTWAGGGGYDPGDLGEDLRKLTLQSGMSLSTKDISHPNLGTCY